MIRNSVTNPDILVVISGHALIWTPVKRKVNNLCKKSLKKLSLYFK